MPGMCLTNALGYKPKNVAAPEKDTRGARQNFQFWQRAAAQRRFLRKSAAARRVTSGFRFLYFVL